VAKSVREAFPKGEQQERAADAALRHELEAARRDKHIESLTARMAALCEQLEAASAHHDAAKAKHGDAQKETDRLKTELAQEAYKKATDETLQMKAPNPLPPGGSGGVQATLEADGEQAALTSSWTYKAGPRQKPLRSNDVLMRTLRDLKAHVDAARAAEAAKAAKDIAAATAAAAAAEAEAAVAAAKRKADEEAKRSDAPEGRGGDKNATSKARRT
jgi:hypothetical protein